MIFNSCFTIDSHNENNTETKNADIINSENLYDKVKLLIILSAIVTKDRIRAIIIKYT